MRNIFLNRRELRLAIILVASLTLMDLHATTVQAEQGLATVEPADFVYPVPWLTTGPARQRMEYSHLRNRMLKVGFDTVTSEGMKSAKQDYDAARKLCCDDPRLDYAFGLVLWAHGHSAAAISQFENAARLQGTSKPFLPAVQAAAWGCLATNQDDRGLKLLVSLATAVGRSNDELPTPAQKRDAAWALGRTFGYLEGPGRSDQRNPEVERAEEFVVAALPADLRQQFERGKVQINERHAELKALVARPVDEIHDEFVTARSQLESDLVAKHRTIKESSQEIAKTHGTHRKTYRELTAKINAIPSQMANLECHAARANQAIANLSTPRERTGQRDTGRTRTETEYERRSDGSYRQVSRRVPVYETYSIPESSCERQARVSQLNTALAEMRRIQQEVIRLRKDAAELPARRKEAISQNAEVATAIRRELNEQYRTKRELSQQIQQLEQGHRALIGQKSNADSLLAYVPWDVHHEREALTKSYVFNVRSP